jgi:hypothetical protein
MTLMPGHRPSQQSHPTCTGTCISESEFVSPPETHRVHDTPSGEEHQVPAEHHHTEAPFKWADIILDAEQLPQNFVTPPKDSSKVEDEWPKIPQHESLVNDTMDPPLQQHSLHRQNESDRVPTDAQEFIRDTLIPTDTSGTWSNRTKNHRPDKSSTHLDRQ